MPISYAQNLEDIRLARAFEGRDSGFYIDVGACHPIDHSVTKYFYLRGWRGINVEPQFDMIELLRLDRPGDRNLPIGLSDFEGSLTLHEAADCAGISTFDREWREGWAGREGRRFAEREVAVTTLSRIFEEHADRAVDFLKIDAEGHEDRVMAGCDFSLWRPRVLLIEGEAGPWEPGLLAAGYEFAVFDGINRFYVREEDRHLAPRLAEPVSGPHIVIHHEFRRSLTLQEELDGERARHEATRRSLEEARARLALTDDLGPSALGLVRRGKRLAGRHPRLAGLVLRALGVNSARQGSA